MTLLIPSPPIHELSCSRGDDLWFQFVYKPLVVDVDGNPVLDAGGKRQFAAAPYPDNSSVALIIETDEPIEVDGEISGSVALFWEPAIVADTVPKGKLWRVALTFADGRVKVLTNGTTIRSDGQPPK